MGAEVDREPCTEVTSVMATNPFQFIQAVRSEAAKVTWPTRRETMVTTALVFLMVIAASIFFVVADYFLHLIVGLVLGLGGR